MRQPSFWTQPLPAPVEVAVMRDAAMAQVAARAEPIFDAAGAARFILAYLQHYGPTAGEVLTMACKADGFIPHDDRAFGPVYFALVRRGQIAKVGTVKRLRGHGTAGGNVWEAK